MLDRKNGPKIHRISNIQLPEFQEEILDNGTKLVVVNLGTQDLINMLIVHSGGRHLEHKKGVSRATASLLKEGFDDVVSKDIAEKVDFMGSSLSTGATLDYSFIKLFTLSKYFDELLPIVEGIRYRPTFQEAELEKYIENRKRRLKIDLSKNDVIAYKSFTEELFGSDHPYGYNTTESVFDNLNQADLKTHFADTYGSDNCTIFLSGKITDEIIQKVKQTFGKVESHTKVINYDRTHAIDYNRKIIHNKDSQQACLRMGFPLFNKKHEDYARLYVANTILGGFFGSRLMKSIREEKGYTYGVYSSIDTLRYDGYFSIQTDVNDEYVEDTISIIYDEIEKMCTVPVSDFELNMVKNYINGNLLNLIDGPFKVGKMAKTIVLNDLSRTFLHDISTAVSDITPQEIMKIMSQYFGNQEVKEIIVTH